MKSIDWKSTLLLPQQLLDQSCQLSGLASLALRLYLFPIFWLAGTNKLNHFNEIVAWFGPNGLDYPLPLLMASLATTAELAGSVLLLLGLATRWATIPLMITMIVAAVTVHWQHGWQAVHDTMSPWSTAATGEAMQRLEMAKSLLQEYGNYQWLTEYGHFIISNNGIEWAATYFIMLLSLFFLGGGKYVSMDYWIRKHFMPE
ncbi:DoxX family protein [Thiomicrorhabdus sediminis]|uniref:DoxX family protein n=1 Tax=Thiomicrorhabdus sediminis TaxID=2580412 RepID=A0A4P9K4I1_9GAMM|nr:DoxX family protein [Thiomicrorhabdus sediminis]QCU89631.1 DoxX family protein [Thiomicrorhabdus sediminis]